MKLIVLVILMSVSRALSCGMAWDGSTDRIRIAGEKALIVWDESLKQQHFFRSVHFTGAGRPSGFIVPVPALPEVADASDDLFSKLDNAIEAERPTRYSFSPKSTIQIGAPPPGTLGGFSDMTNAGSPPVNVIAEYKLENYDVKVIEALSIDPLNSWLMENSFVSRPALSQWLDSYIQQKWFFVVFVFRPNAKENFSTKTVRISFKTEKPFYPYKEPLDNASESPRELNLYFLSESQFDPKLDDQSKKYWSGPQYSLKINSTISDVDSIGSKSKWLTVWNDATPMGRRPNIDLYFQKSLQPTTILPSELIVDIVPLVIKTVLSVICGILIVVLFWMYRVRPSYFISFRTGMMWALKLSPLAAIASGIFAFNLNRDYYVLGCCIVFGACSYALGKWVQPSVEKSKSGSRFMMAAFGFLIGLITAIIVFVTCAVIWSVVFH